MDLRSQQSQLSQEIKDGESVTSASVELQGCLLKDYLYMRKRSLVRSDTGDSGFFLERRESVCPSFDAEKFLEELGFAGSKAPLIPDRFIPSLIHRLSSFPDETMTQLDPRVWRSIDCFKNKERALWFSMNSSLECDLCMDSFDGSVSFESCYPPYQCDGLYSDKSNDNAVIRCQKWLSPVPVNSLAAEKARMNSKYLVNQSSKESGFASMVGDDESLTSSMEVDGFPDFLTDDHANGSESLPERKSSLDIATNGISEGISLRNSAQSSAVTVSEVSRRNRRKGWTPFNPEIAQDMRSSNTKVKTDRVKKEPNEQTTFTPLANGNFVDERLEATVKSSDVAPDSAESDDDMVNDIEIHAEKHQLKKMSTDGQLFIRLSDLERLRALANNNQILPDPDSSDYIASKTKLEDSLRDVESFNSSLSSSSGFLKTPSESSSSTSVQSSKKRHSLSFDVTCPFTAAERRKLFKMSRAKSQSFLLERDQETEEFHLNGIRNESASSKSSLEDCRMHCDTQTDLKKSHSPDFEEMPLVIEEDSKTQDVSRKLPNCRDDKEHSINCSNQHDRQQNSFTQGEFSTQQKVSCFNAHTEFAPNAEEQETSFDTCSKRHDDEQGSQTGHTFRKLHDSGFEDASGEVDDEISDDLFRGSSTELADQEQDDLLQDTNVVLLTQEQNKRSPDTKSLLAHEQDNLSQHTNAILRAREQDDHLHETNFNILALEQDNLSLDTNSRLLEHDNCFQHTNAKLLSREQDDHFIDTDFRLLALEQGNFSQGTNGRLLECDNVSQHTSVKLLAREQDDYLRDANSKLLSRERDSDTKLLIHDQDIGSANILTQGKDTCGISNTANITKYPGSSIDSSILDSESSDEYFSCDEYFPVTNESLKKEDSHFSNGVQLDVVDDVATNFAQRSSDKSLTDAPQIFSEDKVSFRNYCENLNIPLNAFLTDKENFMLDKILKHNLKLSILDTDRKASQHFMVESSRSPNDPESFSQILNSNYAPGLLESVVLESDVLSMADKAKNSYEELLNCNNCTRLGAVDNGTSDKTNRSDNTRHISEPFVPNLSFPPAMFAPKCDVRLIKSDGFDLFWSARNAARVETRYASERGDFELDTSNRRYKSEVRMVVNSMDNSESDGDKVYINEVYLEINGSEVENKLRGNNSFEKSVPVEKLQSLSVANKEKIQDLIPKTDNALTNAENPCERARKDLEELRIAIQKAKETRLSASRELKLLQELLQGTDNEDDADRTVGAADKSTLKYSIPVIINGNTEDNKTCEALTELQKKTAQEKTSQSKEFWEEEIKKAKEEINQECHEKLSVLETKLRTTEEQLTRTLRENQRLKVQMEMRSSALPAAFKCNVEAHNSDYAHMNGVAHEDSKVSSSTKSSLSTKNFWQEWDRLQCDLTKAERKADELNLLLNQKLIELNKMQLTLSKQTKEMVLLERAYFQLRCHLSKRRGNKTAVSPSVAKTTSSSSSPTTGKSDLDTKTLDPEIPP